MSEVMPYLCWGLVVAGIVWIAFAPDPQNEEEPPPPYGEPQPVPFDEQALDEIDWLDDLYALPARKPFHERGVR